MMDNLVTFMTERVAEDRQAATTAREVQECQVKETIIANYRRATAAQDHEPSEVIFSSQDSPLGAYVRGQRWVLEIMAEVYSYHPDFPGHSLS